MQQRLRVPRTFLWEGLGGMGLPHLQRPHRRLSRCLQGRLEQVQGQDFRVGKRSSAPEPRNLSEHTGYFFVQGEGLPEKGLCCPANYYQDKLAQLVWNR